MKNESQLDFVTDNQDEEHESILVKYIAKILTAIAVIASIMGAVAASLYFYTFSGPFIAEHEKWGVFGDYIGGTLNPIFAFFGLIALLVTIVFQSRELRATKDELKRSVAATEHQTFENMFFQLLRLHQQIVDNVKAEGVVEANDPGGGSPRIIGHAAFSCFCEHLDKELDRYEEATSPCADLSSIEESWERFFSTNYPVLSHYFRNFYDILRCIDDADAVDMKDKDRYTRTLCAQLSAYELKLLFYHGLHPDNKRFLELAEKYALFEQVGEVPIGAPYLDIQDNHFQFYNERAYDTWEPPKPNYSDAPNGT